MILNCILYSRLSPLLYRSVKSSWETHRYKKIQRIRGFNTKGFKAHLILISPFWKIRENDNNRLKILHRQTLNFLINENNGMINIIIKKNQPRSFENKHKQYAYLLKPLTNHLQNLKFKWFIARGESKTPMILWPFESIPFTLKYTTHLFRWFLISYFYLIYWICTWIFAIAMIESEVLTTFDLSWYIPYLKYLTDRKKTSEYSSLSSDQ